MNFDSLVLHRSVEDSGTSARRPCSTASRLSIEIERKAIKPIILFKLKLIQLTGSSRFCTSSHDSRGRKNSNKGSADSREVFPFEMSFISSDAGIDAPFCINSLKIEYTITKFVNWNALN